MSDVNPNPAGVTEKMAAFKMDPSQTQILLIVLGMLVILGVTIYLITLFKRNSLKQTPITKTIIDFSTTDVPTTVSDSKTSPAVDGTCSFSFWIYITGNYEISNNHKLVFERGNSSGSTSTYMGCCPLVALQNNTNALLVGIDTGNNTSYPINTIFGGGTTWLTSNIDYLPLQRWVNISICVYDNTLMILMDGDVFSIATTSGIVQSNTTLSTPPRPILSSSQGAFTIGERTTNNIFFSKFQYYNYRLTQKEAHNIYSAGPISQSFLRYFGIGNYGIRTPIYNIDEAATTK